MDHTGGNKPSQYRHEIGRVICARIEAGETVASIASDPHMPCYATIFRWVKMNPDFADMYHGLRERLAADRVRARRQKWVADAWRVPHEIRLGLRRRWVAGQKSTYDRAWAERLCERIADGETLSAITGDPDMPSMKQVYNWLKRHEEFLDMYLAARKEQRIWLELQIHMVADEVTPETLGECKAEVAWLEGRIGRLTPKHYRPAPGR
jgi:hypothetical protein